MAVVDWDVHHGNGTETAFYDDPNVLTISLHQDNWYPPERGLVSDIGTGDGEGFAINVPLPPGTGMGAHESAFDRIVVPALEGFKPEMIFVASGFDGSAFDPLGRMMMHSKGYARLTQKLMAAADNLCDGRLVMAHEGGYSPSYVPFCGLAVLRLWPEKPAAWKTLSSPLPKAWRGRLYSRIRKSSSQRSRNKSAI